MKKMKNCYFHLSGGKNYSNVQVARIIQRIEKPDDELMFALILKNLSDRQITIDKKLINFIIKRIDRSYSNIFNFIYKIDELSLKRKKSIDFKLIREVLGE